jgi:hypothetical protein
VLAALAATRAELAELPLPPPPPGAVQRWLAAVQPPDDADLSGARSRPPATKAPSAGGSTTEHDTAISSDGTPADTPAANTAASTAAIPAPPIPLPANLALRTATETPTAPRPTAPTPAGASATRTERQPPIHPRPRVQRGWARARPTRHPRARAALVAAVLLVLAAGLSWPRPDPPPIDGVDLAAATRSALGSSDLGALGDPVRRAGCLRAAGVLGLDPDAVPLGGRRVELARGPAVLLVFATGELGVFDVVLVDPDCGPAGGTLLGTARIGR